MYSTLPRHTIECRELLDKYKKIVETFDFTANSKKQLCDAGHTKKVQELLMLFKEMKHFINVFIAARTSNT